MKNQYFGDKHDFRKYGLLRALITSTNLRLGICWMLTANDAGNDGNFRDYLENQNNNQCDPILFEWLNGNVNIQNRRVELLEGTELLGPKTVFYSPLLTDNKNDRIQYMHKANDVFLECDLVFFDPDNGMEVQSKPIGRKNSNKYLYWQEAINFYNHGKSLLIYQHFPRRLRDLFINEIINAIQDRIIGSAVHTFRTPDVLYILVCHPLHSQIIQNNINLFRTSNWLQTKHFV